ncbi:PKC activated phosphatase 1 inhibitor [Echinococcus multilocularis]|uniref:PKC activated phosphatase 1 inhibitor n=1 Tax=Echinococcus multilocularis TaxID=6211 RepID=A0A087VYY7_ECHMU|nr:PKC activated phosphatase 1 inhibitor [Echinococcus multilocularis]
MSGKHEITPKVNFPDIVEDETPTHKRHLTARYDKKTRRLMREKLNLEDFIYAELRKVYLRDDDEWDCEIDVDQLIRLNESGRKAYIEVTFEFHPNLCAFRNDSQTPLRPKMSNK